MPLVSVIIPVHNGAEHLADCLDHLFRSDACDFECIVVDDGSTDRSAQVAENRGARVIRLDGRRGPAHARNVGARESVGEILFFLDSDVLVTRGTIDRAIAHFRDNPDLDAVIGSYDDSPRSKDFISQYRNLMHCYVHQQGRSRASTFWAGCGAVRRNVFFELNGFDQSYNRPAIEDIEFGYRLARAGKTILLDRDLLVKHLKRWTVWTVLKTDILYRGIPWAELILRDRRAPNDLNLQIAQRLSVALVFVMALLAAAAAIRWGSAFILPILALLSFVLCRYWIDPAKRLSRGVIPFGLAMLLAVLSARHLGIATIAYPVLIGYILLLARDRYPVRWHRWFPDLLLGLYMGLAIIYIAQHLPRHMLIFGLFAVLLWVVALNLRFYLFLAWHRRRPLFAVSVIPFHLLYHFYNGVSVIVALTLHAYRPLIKHVQGPTVETASRESMNGPGILSPERSVPQSDRASV
jgi:glycosyltransferase involved in cell wall biosynthesis